MPEPRVVRVGTLVLHDGQLMLSPEAQVDIEARGGEPIDLAFFFDYREGSPDRERVDLTLEAELGGRHAGRAESRIDDLPGVSDDRRGYFAVRVQAPREGAVEGKAEIKGTYAVGAWLGRETERTPVQATVPVRIRVK